MTKDMRDFLFVIAALVLASVVVSIAAISISTKQKQAYDKCAQIGGTMIQPKYADPICVKELK